MFDMTPIKSPQMTERFALRMTSAEVQMLNDLVELTGLSAADVLRQLVRREHAEKCATLPKPPKQSRKRG